MKGKSLLNSRWLKAGILLLPAALGFMQGKSTAAYLFACSFLCFAWCEAFRRHSPPIKLTFKMDEIYSNLRNSDYRPEPMVLTIGMVGVMLCLCSLIAGIAHLIQAN
jgi:hypothetical protein